MKTADLKAGELYAVRRQHGPCLLLSTDVHEEFIGRQAVRYSPAPGEKPRRDSSKSWGFDKRSYGYLFLTGDSGADTLAGIVPGEALAAILRGNHRDVLPEGVGVELVTSPAAILGRYEAHLNVERLRLDAERARRERELDRRLAAVARHNAAARRLNVALGSESIRLAELDGYSEPTGVLLTLAQAERIADLLDTLNPEGPTS